MPSMYDWRQYFKKLTPAKKAKLTKAIKALESDAKIKKEFNWTGIFSLPYLMNTE